MTGPVLHPDVEQGSDAWLAMRCGMLTASEMRLILTPTLKVAANDKQRAHVWELAAQRITRYVEPHYISDDMLRGQADEIDARALYAEQFAPVQTCGFMTNSRHGVTIGYSPDGLVRDHGLIEIKSRRQKYQLQTIADAEVPLDYWMQVQTGLLVSERKWLDFVSYSGGLPMVVIRVHPDARTQAAIIEAALAFEQSVAAATQSYRDSLTKLRNVPTERRVEMEMHL